MAAGLGFKDFVTGEVLTAADVDGYLMQGVWVFASAAARDAAVTSPQEGNFAYLKDTNQTTYYTGSAWANLDTTGMTNPMTTTGDTIYSSSGSTPARLGIGSTGNVLTVSGGLPVWSAPAGGGGMTLINTGGTTLTGSSITISSIPATYNHLQVIIRNALPASDAEINLRVNGDTGANYGFTSGTDTGSVASTSTYWQGGDGQDNGTGTGLAVWDIFDYANTTSRKSAVCFGLYNNTTTPANFAMQRYFYYYDSNDAINSVTVLPSSGNFTSGTIFVYGVK